MKRFSLLVFVSIAAFFLLALDSSAIVTGNLGLSESDPSGVSSYSSFDWNYVYQVSGASGVAVDPYWVLMAGHVSQGNITHNGITYTALESITHPDADLRLVRYDKAFDGWYPIYTEDIPVPPPPQTQKLTGLMVGYGRSGNVLSSTTYEWHGSATAGTKRWGDSLIDSTGSQAGIGDYFILSFDTNATTYAAGAADKDSGGGVFVQADGIWYLAGTLVSVTGSSGAYTGSVAVDLRSYDNWIMQTIPEPSVVLLVSIAGGLIYTIKRRIS